MSQDLHLLAARAEFQSWGARRKHEWLLANPLFPIIILTDKSEAKQRPPLFLWLISAQTPSPSLPSMDLAPYDLLCSISPCRFWPRVPEQGVHQLLADADFFYLRQFSRLHILEHSFKEETEVNKQSVLLMCSLKTRVSHPTDFAALVLSVRPAVEYQSTAGTTLGQGGCTNTQQWTSVVPPETLQQTHQYYVCLLQ